MTTDRPGMPTVEFHGYTPEGVENKHYGTSDIDSPLDATPFVRRLSWSHSVQAPWETLDLTLAIPRELWRQVLPGALLADGRRTPQTGFWVVVREPGTGTAFAWGRCNNLSTGLQAVDSGLVETLPVQIKCLSWFSLLQSSRVLLSSSATTSAARGFVYNWHSWGPKLLAQAKAVVGNLPGSVLDRIWRGNRRKDGIIAVTAPTSLVSGEGGDPYELGDEIPVVYTTRQCLRYAPQRFNAHTSVPGSKLFSVGAATPQGTIGDWLLSTFRADPNVVELFPSLEYPEIGKSRPRGLLDIGTGTVARSEKALAAGKGDKVEIDAGGETYLPDSADSKPRTTSLSRALGGAMPCMIYRIKPFLRFPISQESAEEAIGYSPGSEDKQLRPGVPASEKIGAFQTPIETLPRYGSDWYRFFPDEITALPNLTWDEGDRINAVFVKAPLQNQTQTQAFGTLGTPIMRRGELAKHGLRMYEVDWPYVPKVLEDSDIGTQESSIVSALDSLIEASYMIVGDSQRFARGSFTAAYKPWTKAGMWFRAQFVEEAEGFSDISETLDAYIETVTHTISVDEDGNTSGRTDISFSRGSAGGYTPVPVRPADFEVRTPDVTFDSSSATPPPTTSNEDLITPNFKWSEVDPHNQVRVPPTHKDYAKLRGVAANLRLAAGNLEQYRKGIRGLAGANPALSYLADAELVITPHGGYHGEWEDINWLKPDGSKRRTDYSQHRKGKALDFYVRYNNGTQILGVKQVVEVLLGLITIQAMDSGHIETYTGDIYVHYDIRFRGTKKPPQLRLSAEASQSADAGEGGQ